MNFLRSSESPASSYLDPGGNENRLNADRDPTLSLKNYKEILYRENSDQGYTTTLTPYGN